MARPTHRSGNLPAEVTSFIGRRRELAEVRTKLAQARLVSLVGPGGVGKTRVALRAAAGLGRRFRDGTWLAELADLPDPSLVASAVAAALDLRDQAAADPLALLLSGRQPQRARSSSPRQTRPRLLSCAVGWMACRLPWSLPRSGHAPFRSSRYSAD
jgi:hypothetical protein